MADPDDPIHNKDDDDTLPESDITPWDIKEDFLLACAVHRYGTNSWDSVSFEIQKRLNLPSPISPLACQHKFYALHHRFSSPAPDSSSSSVPWLPHLRKLRVAQLKREVQRYDLSIVSLQLKVKRLTEERFTESSDLQKIEHVETEPPAKSRLATLPGDNADQSVNGSNSTDPKGESSGTEPDHATPVAGDSTKPTFEGSYNGSSDSIVKQLVKKPEDEDDDRVSEPSHSPESVAESERNKDGMMMKDDNSDVQSSVKSQPGTEDQSPAIKSVSIQSQPLVSVLEHVLSHRLGSFFRRRLEGQDSTEYKKLIRQHIDLEIIKNRLEQGWYSDNHLKFFRDLLLLCNNALVFFQNKSSEWVAAIELQRLVFKEMPLARPKSDPRQSLVPTHLSVKPPTDQDLSGSLVSNQKGPLITCRKRSSITAKASNSSETKKDLLDAQVEKKQVLNFKPTEKPLVDVEEQPPTKKRINNERITYSSRNSAKNGKSRTTTTTNNTNNNSRSSDTNLSKDPEHKVADKKNDAVAAGNVKKKDVANFLNRMKRGSSSDNGPLLESLKRSSALNSENRNKGGADRKRNNGSSSTSTTTPSTSKDENARREHNSRRSSGGRQTKDEGSVAKRSVGRPARAAALPPPPPPSSKRNREASESEALPSSRQAKKRSRK